MYKRQQDRLAEYARANELGWVDVLPELAALPRDAAVRCFHDESHFSHLGHDLVSDMLLDPVAEALGLQAPAAGWDPARRREEKARAYALADAAHAASLAGALPKAAALLAEAARLAPDVGLVYQFQSNVAHLRGDRAGVVRALERALTLEPDNRLLQANLSAATRSSPSP